MKNACDNKYVKAVLAGLNPAIIGIILATGCYMTLHSCFPLTQSAKADFRALLITAALIACTSAFRRLKKEKPSPIALIVLSAVLGMLLY